MTVRRTIVVSLVSASLCLAPLAVQAAPPEPAAEDSDAPPEGPAPAPAPSGAPGELPPPKLVDPPQGIPAGEPSDETNQDGEDGDGTPGIEFAVPPPEDDEAIEEVPERVEVTFPDPGMAPNDGNAMLTLGGTTVGLTILGFSTAIVVGLRRGTSLEWLLPSTIVPTVGLLAFGGYGLGLGIQRAIAYHRWEVGYRVIGLPQGGGLTIGGSFALLGAVGFGAVGVFALRDGYTELGASLLGVGIASAVVMPIFFTIGARRARAYQRTGGWKRRPLPPPLPLPAEPGAEGAEGAALRPISAPILVPSLVPLRGGLTLGVGGRF